MKIQELFNFIVDQNITKENRSEYLDKMKEIASHRPIGHMTNQEKVDEEVFKNVFIPKTLDQASKGYYFLNHIIVFYLLNEILPQQLQLF